MDVPYISSGAISKSHYALVRRVESAQSSQQADQQLMAAVQETRHRLAHPALSLKQCKECLIILLYCSMTITSGSLTPGELDFALSHAVNLAEAGRYLHEKKIGYLFCNEIMPANHDLQLMLVNTLRKDLESTIVPRICLALDTLIGSPTPDVIPAVQSRLRDLLSHNSSRTYLLMWISAKIEKRLHDSNPAVATAALIFSADILNNKADSSPRDSLRTAITKKWLSMGASDQDKSRQTLFFHIIGSLRTLGISKENLHVVLGIIRLAVHVRNHALLYESFLLLGSLAWEALGLMQTTSRLSPVHSIRSLLTSRDLNDQYLFISCLECLDPRLWAGTTPDIPSIMEEWEVERVMQLLGSPDVLLRKKTLKIVQKIDANILESYYTQSYRNLSSDLPIKEKAELMTRLLEVIETICVEDGELYARKLKDLLEIADPPAKGHPVSDKIVEMVLLWIHNAATLSQLGCVTTLISSVIEIDQSVGPTLIVVISALASEYCGRLAISPVDILRGLSDRLSLYSPGVQEACLLSMLRLAAECSEVPSDIVKDATDIGQFARQRIRRRCDQFVTLCSQKQALSDIVSRAQSPTLPDFLKVLDSHDMSSASSSVGSQSPKTALSRSPATSVQRSLHSSKLRYAAYEPPKTTGRLHRPPSSRRSSSSRSRGFTDAAHDLSQTVTAGDLALATGDVQLELMAQNSSKADPSSPRSVIIDELVPRMDLITLDSPFISDPTETPHASDNEFKDVWDGLQSNVARGWCESSIDTVVQRLRSLKLEARVIPYHLLPFEGELKILLSDSELSNAARAALRLRKGEDESCLWRLRCDDNEFRIRIRRVLADL